MTPEHRRSGKAALLAAAWEGTVLMGSGRRMSVHFRDLEGRQQGVPVHRLHHDGGSWDPASPSPFINDPGETYSAFARVSNDSGLGSLRDRSREADKLIMPQLEG